MLTLARLTWQLNFQMQGAIAAVNVAAVNAQKHYSSGKCRQSKAAVNDATISAQKH